MFKKPDYLGGQQQRAAPINKRKQRQELSDEQK
jgi:hypothetical protein